MILALLLLMAQSRGGCCCYCMEAEVSWWNSSMMLGGSVGVLERERGGRVVYRGFVCSCQEESGERGG